MSRPSDTGLVREVGPGCFAWLRLPGGWGETNIGLVCGEGASLLIDSPWDQRLARGMLDAFASRITQSPVSLLLNTHADPDHWWGNAELPGAEVIASTTTAAAMREESTPGQLANLRRVARMAGRVPGRAGQAGRYVGSMLAPFDFDDVELRFPDRTFIERHVETVGGREVVLSDLGAAHTSSDAIVLVPDARVAYTGDLLFSGVTPVMWHGPVDRWLGALEQLIALEADVFVPGHGPISQRRELTELHNYWSWLLAVLGDARDARRAPLELAKRLTGTPEFAAFAGWQAPERLYINVATIARQLEGEGPIPADPIARGKAFDGVASLHAHLEQHR